MVVHVQSDGQMTAQSLRMRVYDQADLGFHERTNEGLESIGVTISWSSQRREEQYIVVYLNWDTIEDVKVTKS